MVGFKALALFWSCMAGDPLRHEVEEALREASALFNRGKFWECHEVLERVWLRDTRPRKTFLQGIIKIAAGYHHLQNSNWAGMHHLLRDGHRLLQGFGGRFLGLELDPLLRVVHGHAEWAERAASGIVEGASPVPPALVLRVS